MSETLDREISKIEKVINTQKIIDREIGVEDIQTYYRLNSLPYLVHSPGGFIHMGLSEKDSFSKEDLKEAARFVNKYIDNDFNQVLELAMGRGANSRYLANRNQDVQFFGIDITEKHVKKAEKQELEYNNFKPSKGDFHDLSRFEENQFELVFIIEALCYAKDKEKVLSEVSRVLKPKGQFIIFDGYLRKQRSKLTETERTAQELMEKGMMVEEFEPYQEFRTKISESQFEITEEIDKSDEVLPTLERFNDWSNKYFGHPLLGKNL